MEPGYREKLLADRFSASLTAIVGRHQQLTGHDLSALLADLQDALRQLTPEVFPGQSAAAAEPSPEGIEADRVLVGVRDKTTGRIFERRLDIHYVENANGLILSGENAAGNPSQIAFLSDLGLAKLRDLMGRGPDQPRCK